MQRMAVSNGLNLHAACMCGEFVLRSTLCILNILLLESILVVYFRVYLAHGYQSASLNYRFHLLLTLYGTTDFLRMIIGLYY